MRANGHGNRHGGLVTAQPAAGDTTPTTSAFTATSQPGRVLSRSGGTLYAQPSASTPATPRTNSGPTNQAVPTHAAAMRRYQMRSRLVVIRPVTRGAPALRGLTRSLGRSCR